MRNMGRLFQYNRFVGGDEAAEDTQATGGWKCNKPQQQFGANCPAYAELYPAYACTASIEATATPTAATAATTATATAATTMTSRSIDLALRKYQQWSSKFLPAANTTNNGNNNTMPATTTEKQHTTIATMPLATNADCVTHLSTSSSSQKSNSCSHSCSHSTTTSGYYSRLTLVGNAVEVPQARGWSAAGGDRELLVTAGKRPKVYDCMKDFLRRKLFQQRHGQQQQQQQQQREAPMPATLCKSDTEEDVTSDYDEVDMLDSSYQADEEDASDCSSQCTCPLESDVEETPLQQQQYASHEQQQKHSSTPQKSISPQKSMLSLNCWQNITQYTDSTTEPEEDEAVEGSWGAEDADYQHDAEDSDAGISDCCQLISEKASPAKQRKRQHKLQQQQQQQQQKQRQKSRHNRNAGDGGEEAELLANGWYQPRITTKAALERLQQSPPGSFLLRRKSRSYELCLRAETKVKHFVVVSLADNQYKLKGAKKQFTSLKALVTHHSVMAEQLPLTLALPREYECKSGKSAKWAASEACDVSTRTLRSLRYADDFDTYESLQILGLLQDWQCEANEF